MTSASLFEQLRKALHHFKAESIPTRIPLPTNAAQPQAFSSRFEKVQKTVLHFSARLMSKVKASTKDIQKPQVASKGENQDQNNKQICFDVKEESSEVANTGDAAIMEDVQNVEKYLETSSSNDAQKYVEDTIPNATKTSNVPMLRALLSWCQNQPKPALNLNSALDCLCESVYKNNAIMTKLIVDFLCSSSCTQPQENKQDGGNHIDKLLAMAITRDSKRFIIHQIHRLWTKHAGQLPFSQLLKKYTTLMKHSQPYSETKFNEEFCFYVFLGVGLIDFNQDIKEKLDKFPNDQKTLMKTLLEKKQLPSYPENYINFLCTNSTYTMNDYERWSAHIDRFSFQHSFSEGHNCAVDSDYVVLASILDEINENIESENMRKEAECVRNSVATFMINFTKALTKTCPEVECHAIRVGSAQENTRCFYPDEFDYLLVFTKLRTHFKVKQIENNFLFLHHHNNSTIEPVINTMLQEYEGSFYLNPEELKSKVNESVERVLAESLDGHRRPSLNQLGLQESPENRPRPLTAGTKLFLEHVAAFTRKNKFSTLNLVWGGDMMKYLPVKIDLVPAFEACNLENCQVDKSVHDSLPESGVTLHIVAYNYPRGFQHGYSVAESEILQNLPRNIHRGYLQAKSMRCRKVLQTRGLQHVDNFEELIPTYRLKTALLFLTHGQNKRTYEADEPPVLWAAKIYQWLEHYLKTYERIPHFFLNNENSEEGECLFNVRDGETHLRKRQLNDMLCAIQRILDVLGAKKTCSAHGDLSDLCAHTWRRHNVLTEGGSTGLLSLINGHVYWCLHHDGVSIYNQALTRVSHIASGDMGGVFDIAEVNDQLVVAAQHGLYRLSLTGYMRERIVEGQHWSVASREQCVYSSRSDRSTLPRRTRVDVFSASESWRHINSIALPCDGKHVVTLHVTQARIYASCVHDHTVYVLSHDGSVLSTQGRYGEMNAGELNFPVLCHTGSENTLLIADWFNNRLQLMQSNYAWLLVDLQPAPYGPRSAVYIAGRLYVLSWNRKTDDPELSLYLPSNH